MLSSDDVKTIENIVSKAVAPLVTREEAKGLATKDDLKLLATKMDVAKLDTKITSLDIKMSRQFIELRRKAERGISRLEKSIKREHKYQGEVLQVAQVENRETCRRVDRIERHLGFAPAP